MKAESGPKKKNDANEAHPQRVPEKKDDNNLQIDGREDGGQVSTTNNNTLVPNTRPALFIKTLHEM